MVTGFLEVSNQWPTPNVNADSVDTDHATWTTLPISLPHKTIFSLTSTYNNHRTNDTRYVPIKAWGGWVNTDKIIVWGFVDPTYPKSIGVLVIGY